VCTPNPTPGDCAGASVGVFGAPGLQPLRAAHLLDRRCEATNG